MLIHTKGQFWKALTTWTNLFNIEQVGKPQPALNNNTFILAYLKANIPLIPEGPIWDLL